MRLLRPLLLALALIAAAAGVRAQGASPDDKAAIRGVIGQQLEALGRDDGPAAFGYASPGIQGMFGTPERFLEMVRRGYPAVHRPRSVEYGDLVEEGGRIVQQVEVVGADGQPQLALYDMERSPDGIWRIAGCTLVRSPRVGA